MQLREWQAEAFPLWWQRKQGIIKVVTGGGKTFFAIHCIKEFLQEYLSLIHISEPTRR